MAEYAMRVRFVRHAMPLVDAQRAPADWDLTREGEAEAAAPRLRLRRLTPDASAVIVSSPERKAVQTVALATERPTDSIRTDAGFREIDRHETVSEDFRDARRAWIAGELDARHSNWESPQHAADRMDAALRSANAQTVIVGTHGMVLTAWLISVTRSGAAPDPRPRRTSSHESRGRSC